MQLRNTSPYPTARVKELVKFAAKGFNHTRVCVNVKGSRRTYAGRAYWGVPSVSNAPRSSRYLVVVRIGSPSKFPVRHYYSHTKYSTLKPVAFDYQTWEEALVAVTAHELAHIRQFRGRKKCSEVQASRAELKKLEEFRRRG